jgi:predicted Zn-dependent protease
MKFDLRRPCIYALAFSASLIISLSAEELRLPSFLPTYYGPVFSSKGNPLVLRAQHETNGVSQFLYSIGANESLSVENFSGESPACRAGFNNILGHLNQIIATNKGAFVEITETEFQAEVRLTNVTQIVFAFLLPHSVTIWTRSAAAGSAAQFGSGFQEILPRVNRQRYEESFKEGNVSLGQWQKSGQDYANELLKAGRKNNALIVLQNVLTTAPFNYEAHLTFITNTPDLVAAANSAKVVFKSAEESDQISQAANFIGAEAPTLEKITPLSTNDTGFEVILIPISPCNPWLLGEVASTYQRITDVPVMIRRLDQEWTWRSPDRIARQRDFESALVRLAKKNLDFSGWDRNRYLSALSEAVKSEDALSRYWGHDLLTKATTEPGQYLAEPYLDELCDKLKPYFSKDSRTMYVGITGANIYGGDNNYVFSLGKTDPNSHASLMSYSMMLGKVNPQGFDSRQRLVERIAKELVPASLKQLRIPRSTDPTCPYSYSSGLERLDQKTLTLSDEVKQALSKLKDRSSATRTP